MVRLQLPEEHRRGDDREQRACEEHRFSVAAKQRPGGADERSRETELLEVDRCPVEGAEEAEVDRLELRQEERVLERGVPALGEDGGDRVPEFVERAGAHPPERPGVVLEQRLDGEEPRRVREIGRGRQQERDRRDEPPRGSCAPLAPWAAFEAWEAERERRDGEQRQADATDRDVDECEVGGDDPRCGEADRVRERQPREHVAPRLREPQHRQQAGPDGEHQRVREAEQQDVPGHGYASRESVLGPKRSWPTKRRRSLPGSAL